MSKRTPLAALLGILFDIVAKLACVRENEKGCELRKANVYESSLST